MAIIVLTGGPCGGKSTVLKAIRKEFSSNRRVICLSEVATSLLRERAYDLSCESERITFQEEIFERQMDAENSLISPDRVLIVDRGLLDGSVYWPGGVKAWERYFGISSEFCMDRYSRVIHFESLALGSNYQLNDVRMENRAEAAELDRKTERVWRKHRNRHIFLANQSVDEKIQMVRFHIQFSLRKIDTRSFGRPSSGILTRMVRMGLISPSARASLSA